MPSTTPDSTTNTSAAVTTQNRSYENQLSSDVSFEWLTITQVIASPRNQSMRTSRFAAVAQNRIVPTLLRTASSMPAQTHVATGSAAATCYAMGNSLRDFPGLANRTQL